MHMYMYFICLLCENIMYTQCTCIYMYTILYMYVQASAFSNTV